MAPHKGGCSRVKQKANRLKRRIQLPQQTELKPLAKRNKDQAEQQQAERMRLLNRQAELAQQTTQTAEIN
jgi:hypothetical protein